MYNSQYATVLSVINFPRFDEPLLTHSFVVLSRLQILNTHSQ